MIAARTCNIGLRLTLGGGVAPSRGEGRPLRASGQGYAEMRQREARR